ncbi:MAG: hypothetical protein ABIP54_02075 [Candidatus Andersenbacteria bacterium]
MSKLDDELEVAKLRVGILYLLDCVGPNKQYHNRLRSFGLDEIVDKWQNQFEKKIRNQGGFVKV